MTYTVVGINFSDELLVQTTVDQCWLFPPLSPSHTTVSIWQAFRNSYIVIFFKINFEKWKPQGWNNQNFGHILIWSHVHAVGYCRFSRITVLFKIPITKAVTVTQYVPFSKMMCWSVFLIIFQHVAIFIIKGVKWNLILGCKCYTNYKFGNLL